VEVCPNQESPTTEKKIAHGKNSPSEVAPRVLIRNYGSCESTPLSKKSLGSEGCRRGGYSSTLMQSKHFGVRKQRTGRQVHHRLFGEQCGVGFGGKGNAESAGGRGTSVGDQVPAPGGERRRSSPRKSPIVRKKRNSKTITKERRRIVGCWMRRFVTRSKEKPRINGNVRKPRGKMPFFSSTGQNLRARKAFSDGTCLEMGQAGGTPGGYLISSG